MEDKQQQQQQQQQDEFGAAGGVRRSSRLVESPALTKETRINTNKNKSPFANRRLLLHNKIDHLSLLLLHLNNLQVLCPLRIP
jgi:hypothetical protein